MNENIIPCRVCNKEVSNKAVVCPHCGEIYPANKHGRKIIKATNILLIGTIVSYILVAIAIMAIPYYLKSIFTF
ncbi:MAG: Unknown protein [uncultured Sulfurovum sp.]|uniref:Zinc ribbon domain-containing protein n=1 Tax=uncultured Sulfurovum sp. TaxID=269237 RepID=A0A6S6SIA4_9BACT|nr:MAG: Unknown protein [uncultured Sulfurovum sp.]